jgi:hypothetical protein
MRCERCHRPITTAAFSMPTRGRPLMFGPKCARKAGLIERKERHRAAQAQPVKDPNQLELELSQ